MEQGRVIFETRQPIKVLATAVAGAAVAVLDEHGEAGYLERWVEAPSPTASLNMIRERI